MKISAKQIALGGIFLAICIVSQFIKGANPVTPYITGSFINLMLLCATFYAGLPIGVILGLVTPITSFFISGSPQFPVFLPGIMVGNAAIVLVAGIIAFKNSGRIRLAIGLILGVVAKALLMWSIFSYALIPMVSGGFPEEKREVMIRTLTFNFSGRQLIAAAIGAIIFFNIYEILYRIHKRSEVGGGVAFRDEDARKISSQDEDAGEQ